MAKKIGAEIQLGITGDGKVSAAVGKVKDAVSSATSSVSNLKRMFSQVNIAAKLTTITQSLSLIKSSFSFIGGAFTKSFNFVDSYATSADKMSKFSRAVGLSVADLQKWQYAARRGGVENEQFNKSLVKFEAAVSKAANGERAYLDVFNALGIRVKKTNGEMKTNSDLMLEVADAYSKITNAQDKIGVNEKLFGKSGLGLINVLEGGSAGVSGLLRKREELGGLITEDEAKDAEKFKDLLENVQTLVGGIGKSVAAKLLPTFNKLFDKILGWWKGNSGTILAGIERFGNSASNTISSIIEKLPALLDGATFLLDKFTSLVETFGLGKLTLMAMAPVVTGPLMTGITSLIGSFTEGNEKLGKMGKLLKGFPGTIDLIGIGIASWSTVIDSVRKNLDMLKNTTLKEVLKAMKELVYVSEVNFDDDERGALAAEAVKTMEERKSKVTVDFKNIPKGVSVAPDGSFFKDPGLDLSLGYAFGGD